MFIVEGRTLGVLAALGVVLSMVVVFDRLSDVAGSTEPPSPAAFTTASAAPFQATRHDDESALSQRSVQPHDRMRRSHCGETQLPTAEPPAQLRATRDDSRTSLGSDTAGCRNCNSSRPPGSGHGQWQLRVNSGCSS
jgi:hypothetical protein